MFYCLYNKVHSQVMKRKLVIKTVTLTYLSRRKQETSASLLKAFSCISDPDINPCFCNLRSRFLLRSILHFSDDEDSLSCDSYVCMNERCINNRAVQPFKLAEAVTSTSLCSAPPLLLTSVTERKRVVETRWPSTFCPSLLL